MECLPEGLATVTSTYPRKITVGLFLSRIASPDTLENSSDLPDSQRVLDSPGPASEPSTQPSNFPQSILDLPTQSSELKPTSPTHKPPPSTLLITSKSLNPPLVSTSPLDSPSPYSPFRPLSPVRRVRQPLSGCDAEVPLWIPEQLLPRAYQDTSSTAAVSQVQHPALRPITSFFTATSTASKPRLSMKPAQETSRLSTLVESSQAWFPPLLEATSYANVNQPRHPPKLGHIDINDLVGIEPYVPSSPIQIPPPLHIRWREQTIFEDDDEERTAYRMGGRPNVGFFAFGLRYKPGMSAPNIFRTIIITNIAPDVVSLSDILEKIRGAEIISAQLLDTHNIPAVKTISDIWAAPALKSPGTDTALIVFQRETEASRFEQYAAQHHLYFAGKKATVEFVMTETYPISIELEEALDEGATRCLLIEKFPPFDELQDKLLEGFPSTIDPLRTKLLKDLTPHPTKPSNVPVENILVFKDENDEIEAVEVRLTSVMAAVRAIRKLMWLPEYKQSNIEFCKDPCARGFESE